MMNLTDKTSALKVFLILKIYFNVIYNPTLNNLITNKFLINIYLTDSNELLLILLYKSIVIVNFSSSAILNNNKRNKNFILI
jgi:hypothetical protein